jgi:multiple sugar transport system ATP-binding protein
MARVALDRITKVFSGGTVAVDGVTLDVADGEFIVLVGPSGCGKSTVLRMVAGLEEITAGTISIDGEVVNDLPPKARDIAMVFQNYALYPHMTVRDNLSFSLRIAHRPKPEIAEHVADVSHVLGLQQLLDRKPAALSGGQRQRVAMGRAIVRNPRVFLMDEPLSNLDAKLRVAMRAELSRLHHRFGTTTLYVTHDQIEAMTLGDRIAVLDRGRLQQVGTPQELYDSPRNVFVAGFIGSPAMNLGRAMLIDLDGSPTLAIGDRRWPLPPQALARYPDLRARSGSAVVFGLRPEHLLEPADAPSPDAPLMRIRAVTVESLGSERNVLFAPAWDIRDAAIATERVVASDEVVATAVAGGEAPELWTARLAGSAPVTSGAETDLAVDLRSVYLFDADTEQAIPSVRSLQAAVPSVRSHPVGATAR